MSRIRMGFYSGIIGTIVVGALLLMNNALHSVPDIHVAKSLAGMMGESNHIMAGVAAIPVIGIFIFGGLFAALAPKIPVRTYIGKSLIFGVASWLLTMVVFMPLDGSGFFGLKAGPVVPEGMLVLNLAYWIALGMSFSWLAIPVAAPERAEP